jgi:hypothetical protein
MRFHVKASVGNGNGIFDAASGLGGALVREAVVKQRSPRSFTHLQTGSPHGPGNAPLGDHLEDDARRPLPGRVSSPAVAIF